MHKQKNRYSTIANTPTTILVSARGTQLKIDRGLTEPLESFAATPKVLILPETCQSLLQRAPQFPLDNLVVNADREQEYWNDFKQVCLSCLRMPRCLMSPRQRNISQDVSHLWRMPICANRTQKQEYESKHVFR